MEEKDKISEPEVIMEVRIVSDDKEIIKKAISSLDEVGMRVGNLINSHIKKEE